MQALGDEAMVLFPQIDRMALQSGYTYEDGAACYGDRLTVTLREPMTEQSRDTLTRWLKQRYPMVDMVEIVLQQP